MIDKKKGEKEQSGDMENHAGQYTTEYEILDLLKLKLYQRLHGLAPVLGAVNRLAGAALGLCLGVLAMFAAASVLQWTGLVDAATLRDTYLLKYFTQHSPMDIIAMLG
mgnify:CR=1 FL=1